MKLITGTGIAAGALMIAGGTPVAALSQSATTESPLGATSTVTASEQMTDADETEAEEVEAEDTTGDVDEVEGTEPEDTTEDSGAASALGMAHAAAMKIWAHCVADAASGPKTEGQPMPPKTACGVKPLGPGQIMHLAPATVTTDSETESVIPDADADESTAPDDDATEDFGSAEDGWGHHGWGHHGRGHHGASHAPGHHG